MSDTYGVSYSRDALDDLEDIVRYIAHASGSRETARRQARRIRDAIRSLESMPMRHPLVDDALSRQGYRWLTVGGYTVFCDVDEDARRVFAVRIVAGRWETGNVRGSS